MRSLRDRLGAFAAAGTLVVTLIAAAIIGWLLWLDDRSQLDETVTLAAFELADSPNQGVADLGLSSALDPFIAIYDDQGTVLRSEGEIDADLGVLLLDEIWEFTVDQDVATTTEFDDLGVTATGVACTDPGACDSVIVGAQKRSLPSYLVTNMLWLLAPCLVLAGAAGLASRWLVTRSLRPVEAMRVELEEITASDADRRVPVPPSGDELERLGASLNETIGRLHRALQANERFVADAAHELRSPLAGVRAAVEVESQRTASNLLDSSLAEIDRASRLIDDLLHLARRQGRQPVSVVVDLDDLVREEVANASLRFPETEIHVDLTPIRLAASPDDMRRVVANLLDNAAKFGNSEVRVGLESTTAGAVLRIGDDGPGISPGRRAEIFDRFARLDEARDRESGGSGLGLAIVRELVVAMGGSVEVGDSPLGGAAFTVTIPTTPNLLRGSDTETGWDTGSRLP